ncbi:MAG: glycoside hydrolase family 3 N-terminal domain-containing protein [Lachnospiraceae bacterium]|nr:glycoside hydrolase family 3 N-terminal domain-containing protein [Lachnospiraceae bacterium]
MEEYERIHQDRVVKNAGECTVLLKYDGSFPLKEATSIDAFGAGLRYTVKGGTGSGEVNSRVTYTIEQGMERAGFTITSKKWLDAYDTVRAQAKKNFIKQIKTEAKEKHVNPVMYAMGKAMNEPDHELPIEKKSDTAIYVVSRISGEGNDREPVEGDVLLNHSEVRDIRTLNKLYDRFMLVLNVGGVVDLSPVADVKNILLLSQLGTDCGRVLSDILLGKQNPSGKLTTTWSAWEDYSKLGTFGDWDETRYKEGIYVGYRYFDTVGKKALFPFGYGLSYTSFEMKTETVTAEGDEITVRLRVKNSGRFAGKEVAEVYISEPEGKLDKAYQELAGFAKTRLLEPGEEEELSISFRLSDFASYDEETASYVLEAGDYLVRVGNSSADTKVEALINLDRTAVTLKARNCLGKPDFQDCRLEQKGEELPDSLPRIQLRADEIEERTVNYEPNEEIDDRVKALSDQELGYLVIGGFDPNAKGLTIVGNASTHLAGAAGETTSVLKDKGIQPLIMADGPAGIRVANRYYEDASGAHGAGDSETMMDNMFEVLGPVARFIAKKITGARKVPKGAVIKEHMATMIPIGTAIAQSFNPKLAEGFGDLVGEEMETIGVNLWLAPALNIHRSILCGRNFEYYSEDPLVSGIMAAAITRGVQKHPGCGTTIKHFAANNAETNRYCNNSQVSERAMREIYLKGFGICVKEAQPHALMTSYNLLNGTHTSENKGLIEDILRSEFGFRGIVMTDWVLSVMTSKRSVHRGALSNEVIKAGGDLFMPGGKSDYENVMKALKKGQLSRRQMEICATRVVRMVDLLAGK